MAPWRRRVVVSLAVPTTVKEERTRTSEPSRGIESLARSPLFFGVDRSVLQRGAALFHTRTFHRGRPILAQGEDALLVHVISDGFVRLNSLHSDGQEITLGIVGIGDLVGEEALVGEPPRPWTATALEDCQTLAVPATQLVRLFRTNPTLAMNLARYTSLRYAAIATALDNTVRGRVRERLLGALRRLAWQYGFDPPPAGRSRSD